MLIGPDDLRMNRTAAEPAPLRRAELQAAERGVSGMSVPRNDAEDKEETPVVVEPTRETEGPVLQGDNRGARSFHLSEGSEEEQENFPAPPETLPDPHGRGKTLDIRR